MERKKITRWKYLLIIFACVFTGQLIAQVFNRQHSNILMGWNGSCTLIVSDKANSGTKVKAAEYHESITAGEIELSGFKGGASRTNINGVEKAGFVTLGLSYKGALTMAEYSEPIKDEAKLYLVNGDGNAVLTCRTRKEDNHS